MPPTEGSELQAAALQNQFIILSCLVILLMMMMVMMMAKMKVMLMMMTMTMRTTTSTMMMLLSSSAPIWDLGTLTPTDPTANHPKKCSRDKYTNVQKEQKVQKNKSIQSRTSGIGLDGWDFSRWAGWR